MPPGACAASRAGRKSSASAVDRQVVILTASCPRTTRHGTTTDTLRLPGVARLRVGADFGYRSHPAGSLRDHISRAGSGSVQYTVNPTSLDERRSLRRAVPHRLHIPDRPLRLSAM